MTALEARQRILQVIWLDDPMLACAELGQTLREIPEAQHSEEERLAYLVFSIMPEIAMNGFSSLFFQWYSRQDCLDVMAYLNALGVTTAEALFKEAYLIYVRGDTNITDEQYQGLNPFGEGPEWDRFDAIGDQMWDVAGQIETAALERFKVHAAEWYAAT